MYGHQCGMRNIKSAKALSVWALGVLDAVEQKKKKMYAVMQASHAGHNTYSSKSCEHSSSSSKKHCCCIMHRAPFNPSIGLDEAMRFRERK